MDVSIIFINFRTAELLSNAINSVLELTQGITYEIIVVDNASNDGSQQILIDKYGDKINFIPLCENIGFGRANNEGIKVSTGRNIFLLNPDTLLLNNAVERLSNYLDTNCKVGVAGANLYNEDGTFQACFSHVFPSITYELSNLLHLLFLFNRTHINKTDRVIEVKSVVGAALMLKREVVEKAGLFHPDFFMYSEEEEWCNRIRKQGFKIVNVPFARITHLDGRSFVFSELRQLKRLEGMRTLYRVSYSPFYCKVLRVVERLTILSRLAISGFKKNPAEADFWRFMYRNRKWS